MTDIINKANRAAEILNNPLWEETFLALRENYIRRLEATNPRDDLERFRYTESLKMVRTIQTHFEATFAHGKQAAEQAKFEEEQLSLKERVVRLF